MKLGATRLSDSEREKYMKEGKCFCCGKRATGPTSTTRMGHPQKARLPWPFTARVRRESSREKSNTTENDKKKRTSALHSRYDALKETHESEEKGHEEISSSETGTENYQNVIETEKRKNYFCKAENA
jgi:hypothetical protein